VALDETGVTRESWLSRAAGPLISALAVAAVAFHLYAAGVAPFTALVQRPVHLALMASMGFLGLGVRRSATGEGGVRSRWAGYLAPLLVVASVVSFLYLVTKHEELVRRTGSPTGADLALGVLGVLVVLELTRRTTGWGLVAVAVLALVYAAAGPYLPGALAHRGYGATRLVEHLYLSTEGIWGVPLGVSADFVYLFILFGAVLDVAGGGTLLIGLANRVAGGTRGGPAKTAAIGSAFMGSLSGSAVANVVTTGTFTIPLMKRAGFRPYFAGAIEAAASTGGQLMPPVMGAGAFILATWTNIPYVEVAAAAVIPAVLYYVAVVMAIHFRAGRMGLEPDREGEREPVLPRLHLLIPLGAIVLLLVMGRSPMRAAFWGVSSAAVVAFLGRRTRPSAEDLRRAVVAAAGGTVQVAAACAAAGIVVGVASLTGIGLRMSELIVTVSGGQLPIALLLTAAGSIVLGMGLPTTAAYVVLAALGAPALVDLGVPLLAAHLFIFYFGCISNVTPPVSLAAYAASGIAGSPPLRTAGYAMTLAAAGFLVPFMFVYGPPLLLDGGIAEILVALATAVVGVIALAASTMGFARRPLALWERVFLGLASLALMMPGWVSDLVGFAIVGLAFWRAAPGEASRRS
jgi:TRAP transporter 4TM/12TM fusion protein